MEVKVTVTIRKENDWFVAECAEYKISVKSITIEEALENLQRKLHEYLEDEHPSLKANIILEIKMMPI